VLVPSWPSIARRIRVPLSFAFAAVYLWLAQPTLIAMALGMLLVIPGLLLRAVASGHVAKNEQLATSGPYAYTRNPLYLGSLILAVGFAFAARSWIIGIGMVAIFLAIYLPVIRSEEEFLRGRFPEFAEYTTHVPRLLPRLTPATRGQATFSWDLYRKHREYNALLGAAAVFGVLAIKLFWRFR
jgi:protein-S-isoprenylcysteine O-methyltransferase Ste14